MRHTKFIVTAGSALLIFTGLAHAADDMKGMDMKGMSMAKTAAEQVQATGVVKALDAKAGTVTIAHEPIKELQWPAMTMMFKVAKPALLDKVAVGSKVQFSMDSKNPSAGITNIKVQ